MARDLVDIVNELHMISDSPATPRDILVIIHNLAHELAKTVGLETSIPGHYKRPEFR